MRVLITGISGFIGRHLAVRLADAGHELYGLAQEGATQPPAGELFLADLLDEQAIADVVRRCSPEVVVHLAGLSHVGESWRIPGDYYRVNFVGTCKLLEAVGDCRFIFASSSEVYGRVPEDEQPITEDRPLDPRTPYAMTKACAETIALHHGAIVARSFNVVGVGQSQQFALPSFAAQLASIEQGDQPPVLKVGDLSACRDFLHVADATTAIATLIERGEAGGIYNLAGGKAWSIADALGRLREISGVATDIQRDEARVRPVDMPLLTGDTGRLRALGWEPEHTFDEALRDIWQAASRATD